MQLFAIFILREKARLKPFEDTEIMKEKKVNTCIWTGLSDLSLVNDIWLFQEKKTINQIETLQHKEKW
jgi:hypothetical protein